MALRKKAIKTRKLLIIALGVVALLLLKLDEVIALLIGDYWNGLVTYY
jgi:hypothetical protein